MPDPQCGRQKKLNVPAELKVWLYIEPDMDVGALAQFVSLGEQNWLSGVQLEPLVTVWPLLSQVHVTVSPTLIVTVEGWNTGMPFGPTLMLTMPPPLELPLDPPLPLLEVLLLLLDPPLLLLEALLLLLDPLLLLVDPLLLLVDPLLLLLLLLLVLPLEVEPVLPLDVELLPLLELELLDVLP